MRSVYFVLSCAAVLVVAAIGCGRKAERTSQSGSAQPAESQAPTETSGAPAPGAADPNSPLAIATGARPGNAPVVPVPITNPGNLDQTLAELTQALRKYSFENRRLPQKFSEVIAAGYVQPVPTAPAGKKFEIDPKTKQVVLVRQ